MNKKQSNTGFLIGYALIVIGAVVYLLGMQTGFYILGVGVLINTIFRVQLLPKSDDRRIRRLNSQHFIIVAAFVGTAYLMYLHSTAWALTLLVAGVVDFYLTFRYPKQDG